MSSSILQAFSNVYWTTTVVSEYLQDFYCHCGARTGVAKCVLAFDSLCRAQTGVAKRVLAFAVSAELERRLAFNSLCGTQMEVSLG